MSAGLRKLITADGWTRKAMWHFGWALFVAAAGHAKADVGLPAVQEFVEQYCADCHDDVEKEANLDLTSLAFKPEERGNFLTWMKAFERVEAGEMPPKKKHRPAPAKRDEFLKSVGASLTKYEKDLASSGGRSVQRRLNGYEYENSLRDLLSAPWLQIRPQFPEDGEAYRFNKVAQALDVSHVHMTRYMAAADYAIRQILSVQLERPPTTTRRFYARDQRSFTSKFMMNSNRGWPDRLMAPVSGAQLQPEFRNREGPFTVGSIDPAARENEAVCWVASGYEGFTYSWNQFRAPVAGRYRVRFSGYTLWVGPGGSSQSFKDEKDFVGVVHPPKHHWANFNLISPGRTQEPITVYSTGGLSQRRVGAFNVTTEPTVVEAGEFWLLANESLMPDAARFYRSRPSSPNNPLMGPDGAPAVAFRWMEVDGPIYDSKEAEGYRLLFGDLPLRRVEGDHAGVALEVVARTERRGSGTNASSDPLSPLEGARVEVVSENPHRDAARLIAGFVERAYRRPVTKPDTRRFIALFEDRFRAGLSFTEAMIASYTAVLASPAYVFVSERAGPLDDFALANRLALFLWNSAPDEKLRARAAAGKLHRPQELREETERMLNDPKLERFTSAFLDYWIDLRKIEDSTPSTTLYNDYYLDDALTESMVAETQLFFAELIRRDLPTRNLVASDFTFLNERLAAHYAVPDVKGVEMRRVTLPSDSPRGGLMTQGSVLKVTANGTTTSPVLRGKWITERILGYEIPPPPPVAAVEPDIRGATTIREQLEKHRADASCASCHNKMDPPGFALENFDVMGGWRTQYRGISDDKVAEKGFGKDGQAFAFYLGLPVDAVGELPNGREFQDIRELKRLLCEDEPLLARNLAKQLLIFATGAPVRFSDRTQLEGILKQAQRSEFGVRTLIHQIVQSDLFRSK